MRSDDRHAGRTRRSAGRLHLGARRTLTAAFLWAGAVTAACAGPGVEHEGDAGIGAEFGISPTPPMTGTAQVWVRPTGVEPGAFEGTSVFVAVASEGAPSTSEVRLQPGPDERWNGDVPFPRAGPARLQVRVLLTDGRTATLRFPITVSRRPGG